MDRIIGLTMTGWNGALSSISVYMNESGIRVMSSKSQTLASVSIRVAYI